MVERRQPYIRWSAVLAGAVVAAGLWNLLNLIFIGGALSAIDPEEIDHLRAFGIGSGVGSLLAPLIAMFVGGFIGGRLAASYEKRISGLHGGLVWAITSIAGLVIMAMVVGALTDKRALTAHADMVAPAPGTRAFVDDEVRRINVRLKTQHAPTISTTDFLEASQFAATDRAINRDDFVTKLDAETKLSHPEAEVALDALGARAPDAILAARDLATHRKQALAAAEDTGNALLAAGVGLLLCLATSVAGAIFGAMHVTRRRRYYDRPDTIPGHPIAEPVVAEPVVTGRIDPIVE